MLTNFIIISFITWILGILVNGVCLYSLLILVPVVMFALHKFGIHIQLGTIVTCEIIFFTFSLLWRILFHSFVWSEFLLTILLRAIFLGIVTYDSVVYVYITEERKKL